MKNAGLLSSLILAVSAFSAHADPVTPVINGLIAPTGFAVPALPIPSAPSGVPGLPELPGLGGGGAPGLPSGIPSGIPSELPGLDSLPLPGTGGGGAPGLPTLPVGALLPSSSDRDPITSQLNAILTPKTGVVLPALFAPLFNQIPETNLPSLTGLIIASIPGYGDLNQSKGHILEALFIPIRLLLAQNTNPTDYQAALMQSLAHLQNALALPTGGIPLGG